MQIGRKNLKHNTSLAAKFFDPSTPSMRKGRDGGKKRGGKRGGKEKEMTDENSGHYVIASSRPPKRRPLERRTLVPIRIALSSLRRLAHISSSLRLSIPLYLLVPSAQNLRDGNLSQHLRLF